MFAGNTRSLPYIRHYADALLWWQKTNVPNSKNWSEHQRPLGNTRQPHYRLESRNIDEYIDVMLYHTVMARYYKPFANSGNERRLYRSTATQTSKSFVLNVLGRGSSARADADKIVAAPVYTVPFMQDTDGIAFSADYTFDKDGYIVPELSRHTRHWRKVSTKEDVQRRADIRALWEPFLTMAQIRMDDFARDVDINRSAGQPFGTEHVAFSVTLKVQRMHKALRDKEEDVTTDMTDAFFSVARAVFTTMASKRAYDTPGFNFSHKWSNNPTVVASTYADIAKPVTASAFRTALVKRIVAMADGDTRSGYEEIPQFVALNEYPSLVVVTESP